MSEVINKGIEVNRIRKDIYHDTALLPFIGNSGPYGLNKVSGSEFDKIYSSTMDSISWRTASILANSGYDIMALRHMPWKKNIILDLDAEKVDKIYELVVPDIKIGDLYYLNITVVLNKIKNITHTISLWKNSNDKINSIPSIVDYSDISEFYGNNLDDYLVSIQQKLSYYNVFVTYKTEEVGTETIIDRTKWVFHSNSKFHITYGFDEFTDDRTAIRIFNNNTLRLSDLLINNVTILDNLPGYIDDIQESVIRLHYIVEGEDKYIDLYKPTNYNYSTIVSVGDLVDKDSIIFVSSSSSCPDIHTDYSNKLYYRDIFTSLDPVSKNNLVVLAGRDDVGVISIVSNSLIKLFGRVNPIYNPDTEKLIVNPLLNVGDEIKEGDTLFILDPSKLVYDSINTLTYAAYYDLPNEYNLGDYFLLNKGSRSIILLFTNLYDELNKDQIRDLVNDNYNMDIIDKYVNINLLEYNTPVKVNNKIIDIMRLNGFVVNYDQLNSRIYVTRASPFSIKNVSNCIVANYWQDGMYDVICSAKDSSKIITFNSKYPNSTDKLVLNISKDNLNSNSNIIVYRLNINRYVNDTLIDTEEFIFDLSESGEFSYNNINSSLVEIEVHNSDAVIQPGTYTLGRYVTRSITTDMMLSNSLNTLINKEDYELFVDGGIIDKSYRDLWYNKLKSHENLMLFTVDYEYINSNQLSIDYNKLDSVFCYPNIVLGDYSYPVYVSWLINGLLNQYTGDIDISGLEDTNLNKFRTKLMTVDFDGYRYVLTHNYIKTFVNSGKLMFPEAILVLSRIRSAIYYRINYQTSESQIVDQFNNLVPYVMSISSGVLMKLTLDSIKILDRLCEMSVSIYLNNFRADPINLLVKINLTQ